MRDEIIDQDFPLPGNKRLIKRIWKVDKSNNFPDGIEFAYQFLYFKDDEWIQVARIDNQLHKGKPGIHIHILKRDKVDWVQLSFREVEEKILELGENVIRNIINKI